MKSLLNVSHFLLSLSWLWLAHISCSDLSSDWLLHPGLIYMIGPYIAVLILNLIGRLNRNCFEVYCFRSFSFAANSGWMNDFPWNMMMNIPNVGLHFICSKCMLLSCYNCNSNYSFLNQVNMSFETNYYVKFNQFVSWNYSYCHFWTGIKWCYITYCWVENYDISNTIVLEIP